MPLILAQATQPVPTGPSFTTLSADAILSPYIYLFYVAFAVSFLFTPIMRAVALHFGIIDAPDNLRKLHKSPVAYLGGVAVFLGWMCGLAASQFLRVHRPEVGLEHLIIKPSIVFGGCLILALGLWDDVKRISPGMKISGQVVAALMLLKDGVGTRCMAPLLEPINALFTVRLGMPMLPEWFIVSLSAGFVIAVVVGCCNAANLMDGLDGLCGGVTAIIAGGFLFLAVHLATLGGGLQTNWDALRVVIALSLLGAVLGFIPYNFNPASIFMGDAGSMLLGFICAVMIILMGQGSHPRWFLASMIMFALPVLDTALAFARRFVNRRPLFSADRHHFHHQLVSRGFTVKQTVLFLYALAVFFAACGAAMVYMRTRYTAAFYMVLFGFIIVAAYKMGMIHERAAVVDRRKLGERQAAVTSTPDIEPATVLEVRESDFAGLGEPPATQETVRH